MKQSSLIQGLHFPYELQVISSENDMESFKSWKASSSLKEDKASPDIVWETGQTVPFESGLSILRWSNDASIELLQMQDQGCVLLPSRPMQRAKISTFAGNFGRGVCRILRSFARAKLPQELIVEEVRSFLCGEGLTWFNDAEYLPG